MIANNRLSELLMKTNQSSGGAESGRNQNQIAANGRRSERDRNERLVSSSNCRVSKWGGWIVVVGLCCNNFAYNVHQQLPGLCTSSRTVGTAKTSMLRQSLHHHHEYRIPELKVHSPCPEIQSNTKYNATQITARVQRFSLAPYDTWTLSSHGENANQYEYTLHFQLLECPPQYMASTFHIQSSTEQSIFTGTVGPRYRVEEGCGFYNASVPIVLSSALTGNAKSVFSHTKVQKCGETVISPSSIAIEAFWTSRFRNYANRLEDKSLSEKIKAGKDNYTTEDIALMVGQDRLEYLARHSDLLPGFPLALELPPAVISGSNSSLSSDAGNDAVGVLPCCSEVPLADWLPVGVSSRSDDSPWQFQSNKCQFTKWTRDNLDYWLAGLRIRYLADSHGQYENMRVFEFACPEAGNIEQFYRDRFDCPQQPNNTFSFGYRFYRGILKSNGLGMDGGLSEDMRHVRPKACASFLGLGSANVTIITTPTWLFVYEIEESLYEYLQSLKNLIQLCRRLHPSEMENLVILVQSPTASDVLPSGSRSSADEWRQNHNFREEKFTHALYSELGRDLIDGIIPVFEWTLAQNWKQRTSDGVHQYAAYYSDIIHVQSSAIISAMKFSKGWEIPLMSRDDHRTHWFYNVSLP